VKSRDNTVPTAVPVKIRQTKKENSDCEISGVSQGSQQTFRKT